MKWSFWVVKMWKFDLLQSSCTQVELYKSTSIDTGKKVPTLLEGKLDLGTMSTLLYTRLIPLGSSTDPRLTLYSLYREAAWITCGIYWGVVPIWGWNYRSWAELKRNGISFSLMDGHHQQAVKASTNLWCSECDMYTVSWCTASWMLIKSNQKYWFIYFIH